MGFDRFVGFCVTATLTYDTLRFGEFEDFPETSEPVWILGKEFNALTGGSVLSNPYLLHNDLSLYCLTTTCSSLNGIMSLCFCSCSRSERDDILADVTSRLWFTYRKNFQPIGELRKVVDLFLFLSLS